MSNSFDGEEPDGMISSVFDPGALAVRAKMYQNWAQPGLHPDEPLPCLQNWPLEDKIAFCGGTYALAAYSK